MCQMLGTACGVRRARRGRYYVENPDGLNDDAKQALKAAAGSKVELLF